MRNSLPSCLAEVLDNLQQVACSISAILIEDVTDTALVKKQVEKAQVLAKSALGLKVLQA